MKKKLMLSAAMFAVFCPILKGGGLPPGVALNENKKAATLQVQTSTQKGEPVLSTYINHYTQGLKKGTAEFKQANKKARENFKSAYHDYLKTVSKSAARAKKPIAQKKATPSAARKNILGRDPATYTPKNLPQPNIGAQK